jgi:hypothetical protein
VCIFLILTPAKKNLLPPNMGQFCINYRGNKSLRAVPVQVESLPESAVLYRTEKGWALPVLVAVGPVVGGVGGGGG